jgi:DNA-binding transcriptional LysR family regulator
MNPLPPFELRHLRYFVAVAEELHFGRAAQRLMIAQPSLSTQIRDLERAVGAPLLERTRRHVELTAAGKVFLESARQTLALVERAVQSAQRAHRGEIGQVNLGFVGSAAYEVLPRLLRAFRAAYPDVALQLSAMTTNEQVMALAERQLDLGLLRLSALENVDARLAQRLAWRVVAREPLVAVLPRAHPLASLESIPLAALANEAFILYPRSDSPAIHDAILACCLAAGFSPNITQESGEMQAIVGMVAGFVGVALVIAPEGYRATGDVVFTPLTGATIPLWEMALAWRSELGEGDLTPAARALLALSDALWP